MDFLPIFLNIRGKKLVVDGGTTVAARRVERALLAGAHVHVFDANLGNEFATLMGHENLTHHNRSVTEPDLAGAIVAYGASEDVARDATLHSGATKAGVLVNVADVSKYCDFITPSVVDRSPLVIAISSGGTAPVITRILRARIESLLPPAYGRMAAFLGSFRDRVSAGIKSATQRRRFWETMIDGPAGNHFLAGDHDRSETELLDSIATAKHEGTFNPQGEVFLVGAGPGDPDLLTFRALRLMQRCDVVLYDRLVADDILDLVRRDAERIYVGKRPKQHIMFQEDISALMVKLASEGKRVLRLKGGDPFIFGRGGEEIEMLAEHNIPFQVVPGITAAQGCSTYAGIPLTHRDHAQSCIFVTAHGRDGVLDLDWEVLTRKNQTVAVYMGLSSLKVLSEGFASHGVDPDTPAAIIDNGTRPNQRIITGTVADLYQKATEAEFTGPSMIIIGGVVTLRDKLSWFADEQDGKFDMSLKPKGSL